MKIINNLLAAGLPALVLLFGLLCLRYWWRNRKQSAVLLGGVCAAIYGAVTIANLAVSGKGRFCGRYTWGPRYLWVETAGLVLLTVAFLSLGFFVLGKGKISIKKPLLYALAAGAVVCIAFFLLETFG